MALNARKKKDVGDFEMFDVLYEDGARLSNRKVPTSLDREDGDDKESVVRAFLEEQDRKIAEASGKVRGAIKTILPAGR